jgi:hypothetical protein
MRERVPLRHRRYDLIFIGFFLVNLCLITYIVDIEQLTVANPADFSYPAWPPHWAVALVHWYGGHYDPLLMARPRWWQMTIWIDVVYFGPFYLAAVLAFARGWDGIRVPALVWSGLMLANVTIILGEEWAGPLATPHRPMVFGANAPWLLLPLAVIWRLRRDHPFTRPLPAGPPPGSTPDAAGPATDTRAAGSTAAAAGPVVGGERARPTDAGDGSR